MRAFLCIASAFAAVKFMGLYPRAAEKAWIFLQEEAGSLMDFLGDLCGRWISRHGFYLSTYPDYQFISWTDAALYATLAVLVMLLVKYEGRIGELKAEIERIKALQPGSNECRTISVPAGARRETPARRWVETAPEPACYNEYDEEPIEEIIADAIENDLEISFDYSDRDGVITRREVEPYRLYVEGGRRYLEGECRLRNDMRTFRLSRMWNVEVG